MNSSDRQLRLELIVASLIKHVGTVVNDEPVPSQLKEFADDVLSAELRRRRCPAVKHPGPNAGDEGLDLDDPATRGAVQAAIDECDKCDFELPRPKAGDEDGEDKGLELDAPATTVLASRRHRCAISHGMEVQAEHLDDGGMYIVSESVWSGCLCIGLDCIGFNSSLMIFVNMCMAGATQCLFIYICASFMAEDPTAPEKMYDLLRFRASVGHDVAYTDKLDPRSLIRRICDQDGSLHIAGLQYVQLKNLREFADGGLLASHLAMISWLLALLKELMDIFAFGHTILHLPTAHHTRIQVHTGSGSDAYTEAEASEMRSLQVGTDLIAVSARRKMLTVAFVLVPRVFVVVCLGFSGCLFLAVTSDIVELLLNTTALYFILDLDEMIYAVCAPRRLHMMIRNLVPLPSPVVLLESKVGRAFPACLKLALLALALSTTSVFLILPFMARLDFMEQVLCDGNIDFVASPNPVSNIMTATATENASVDFFDSNNGAVLLEMTAVNMGSKERNFLPESIGTYVAEYVDGKRRTGGFILPRGTSSLQSASPHDGSIGILKKFPTASVEWISSFEPCKDGFAAGSQSQLENALSNIGLREFGDSSIRQCWQLRRLCGRKEGRHGDDLSAVRLLCPRTCGCHSQNMFTPNAFAGVFAHTASGCPKGCHDKVKSYQEWWAAWWTAIECVDTPTEAWGMGVTDMSQQTLVSNQLRLFLTGIGEIMSKNTVLPFLLDDVLRLEGVDFIGGNIEDTVRRGDLIQSLQDGRVIERIRNGSWEILDGIPHPRGLTGCAFIASFEVQNIWRLDLCKPGPYASLRPMCPQTCGCEADMLLEECPVTCSENVTISADVFLTQENFASLDVYAPWIKNDKCAASGKFCKNWHAMWQQFWTNESGLDTSDFGSPEYCSKHYLECWW
eukprot:TRINITY_DN17043_c0_g1_i2.p1 TRINITY_DN17043_c0_g1~~TRINITY_DN17043_c0_g1_i2.p1  ORF type:complete len:906 (+),score=118.38 TRINITY_DN17043_c0_g1_i2:108-2825(+)